MLMMLVLWRHVAGDGANDAYDARLEGHSSIPIQKRMSILAILPVAQSIWEFPKISSLK